MLRHNVGGICDSYNRNRGSLLKTCARLCSLVGGLSSWQEIAVVKRGLPGLKEDWRNISITLIVFPRVTVDLNQRGTLK